MRYVQYFWDKEGKADALGDRGVVVLDARNSIENSCWDARQFNGVRRPKYGSFQLYQGETFTRSSSITRVFPL